MNTNFPSKAAQNDALYLLSKQLEKIQRAMQELYLAGPRGDGIPRDIYYSFPSTIGLLSDKKIQIAASFYPQFSNELRGLIVARDVIKATPIVKPVSKASVARAAAEKVIIARGDNDTLKSEMLKIAPQLEMDFANRIRDIFAKKPDAVSIARFVNRHLHSLVLDVEYLDKYAHRYGIDTATIWYGKMASKIGAATQVSVVRNQLSSNVSIFGEINGQKVEIDQQIVFGRSCRGRHYHQFPARIYVDGKFTTEAAFAKAFHNTEVQS
jgi:hypothetical protein